MKRTHYCGELRKNHLGQTVTLVGWVWHWRDHGGVVFIDLRDRTGHSQLVFDPTINEAIHKQATTLRSEFCIGITGTVKARMEGTVNPNMPTGEIEIFVDDLHIFNEAETPPFPIDDHVEVGEDVRLKYRYLDMRRPTMRNNLVFRSKCYHVIRNYFYEQNFIEIETPVLSKSTPEGARDFLVPSRICPGEFFALPQSPQIYKQLCMIGGLDRYIQIVKCFRDEDQRADRQPEFTQIDVEMSFVTPEDIYETMEGLMARIWKEVKGIELQLPFPRMPYNEAMSRFGCDRPDTRFGMELKEITGIGKESEFKVFQSIAENGGKICGICVKGGAAFSRKDIEDLTSEAAIHGSKGLAWMKHGESGLESNIVKFFSKEQQHAIIERLGSEVGDLLLFVADEKEIVYPSLSHLRLHLGAKMKLYDPKVDHFLWVTDWPLFEKDDQGNPTPSHHPFTAPFPEHVDLLETDPLKIKAQAYDLILNGIELGGGSIRIHQRSVQQRAFKALGIGEEQAQQKFGFLLDAFRYGAPPHGGIAFGLDRMIMLLLGAPNIREVIAFPKNQRAQAVLEDAPSPVEEDQLKELSLRLRKT